MYGPLGKNECQAALVLLRPVLGHGLVELGSLRVALLLVFRHPIVVYFGPPAGPFNHLLVRVLGLNFGSLFIGEGERQCKRRVDNIFDLSLLTKFWKAAK